MGRGLVLVGAVVGDLPDLDGSERGAEAVKGRELVGGQPVARDRPASSAVARQQGLEVEVYTAARNGRGWSLGGVQGAVEK